MEKWKTEQTPVNRAFLIRYNVITAIGGVHGGTKMEVILNLSPREFDAFCLFVQGYTDLALVEKLQLKQGGSEARQLRRQIYEKVKIEKEAGCK